MTETAEHSHCLPDVLRHGLFPHLLTQNFRILSRVVHSSATLQ